MSKAIKNKLKPQWEMFCQYYVSYDTFGNATKSYAKAYNKDLSNKKHYASCRTEGYRLLTIPDILERINELLTQVILNDTSVDTELAFVIMQREDLSSKMRGIAEYNKLKSRIEEKLKLDVNPIDEILEKYGKKGGVNDVPGVEGAEDGSSKNSA